MRARLDHLTDELDFAFYEICCHEWVYIGLLLTSAPAALACAVAANRSATLAGRALWTAGSVLCCASCSHPGSSAGTRPTAAEGEEGFTT